MDISAQSTKPLVGMPSDPEYTLSSLSGSSGSTTMWIFVGVLFIVCIVAFFGFNSSRRYNQRIVKQYKQQAHGRCQYDKLRKLIAESGVDREPTQTPEKKKHIKEALTEKFGEKVANLILNPQQNGPLSEKEFLGCEKLLAGASISSKHLNACKNDIKNLKDKDTRNIGNALVCLGALTNQSQLKPDSKHWNRFQKVVEEFCPCTENSHRNCPLELQAVECKPGEVIAHRVVNGCPHYYCESTKVKPHHECPLELQSIHCKPREKVTHRVDSNGCPQYYCVSTMPGARLPFKVDCGGGRMVSCNAGVEKEACCMKPTLQHEGADGGMRIPEKPRLQHEGADGGMKIPEKPNRMRQEDPDMGIGPIGIPKRPVKDAEAYSPTMDVPEYMMGGHFPNKYAQAHQNDSSVCPFRSEFMQYGNPTKMDVDLVGTVMCQDAPKPYEGARRGTNNASTVKFLNYTICQKQHD